MPIVAVNSDTEKLVLVQDATGRDSYACPDCDADAEYVRGHSRQLSNGDSTTVQEHFRYPNCDCYGTVPSNKGLGSAGGGGGGGESQLHKRRKKTALAEAVKQFDNSEHNEERQIGDKQADAVLVFEEPHPEYGKGLAIEYQHKNESKDRVATEQEYARNEFTTLWLWEEQFDFSTSVPEVDLFGGEVYTPWPDAVPEVQDWWSPKHNYRIEHRDNWSRAKLNGLVKYGSDASLPPEWHDEKALEIWRNQSWATITGKYDSTHAFLERDTQYAQQYIKEVRSEYGDKSIEAVLPPKCSAQMLWKMIDWASLFTVEHAESYIRDLHYLLEEPDVNVSAWEALPNLLSKQAMRLGREGVMSEYAVTIDCPHCNVTNGTDPIHAGEQRRGTRCTECRRWFVVYEQ